MKALEGFSREGMENKQNSEGDGQLACKEGIRKRDKSHMQADREERAAAGAGREEGKVQNSDAS